MASKSKKKTPPVDVPGIAAACDALSCGVRAAVVAHLSRSGPSTVGELQQSANTSASGVSQHLAKLRAAGAVTVRRDAQRMIYSPVPGWVERLIGKLREMVGGGEDASEFVAGGALKGGKAKVQIERAGGYDPKIGRAQVDPSLETEKTVKPKKRNPILLGTAEVTPKRPDATESPETVADDTETAQTAEARPDAKADDDQVGTFFESIPIENVNQDGPPVMDESGQEIHGVDPEMGTNYSPGRGW